MELRPGREKSDLAETISRILDKGLVINADIVVSVSGTELLGIKIRAALASFETAAKYGLEFPSGTNLTTEAWRNIEKEKADCPNCGNRMDKEELVGRGCYICGWTSQLKKEIKKEVWVKERSAMMIVKESVVDEEENPEEKVSKESDEKVKEKKKEIAR